MLLCNPVSGDLTMIRHLGNSLSGMGDVAAAHACYVCAGDRPSSPWSGASPMQLLGMDKVGSDRFTVEAIRRTEMYEYALGLCSGDGTTTTAPVAFEDFHVYRLVLATVLAEAGKFDQATKYIDGLGHMVRNTDPAEIRKRFTHTFIVELDALASRLRGASVASYCDSALNEFWVDGIAEILLLYDSAKRSPVSSLLYGKDRKGVGGDETVADIVTDTVAAAAANMSSSGFLSSEEIKTAVSDRVAESNDTFSPDREEHWSSSDLLSMTPVSAPAPNVWPDSAAEKPARDISTPSPAMSANTQPYTYQLGDGYRAPALDLNVSYKPSVDATLQSEISVPDIGSAENNHAKDESTPCTGDDSVISGSPDSFGVDGESMSRFDVAESENVTDTGMVRNDRSPPTTPASGFNDADDIGSADGTDGVPPGKSNADDHSDPSGPSPEPVLSVPTFSTTSADGPSLLAEHDTPAAVPAAVVPPMRSGLSEPTAMPGLPVISRDQRRAAMDAKRKARAAARAAKGASAVLGNDPASELLAATGLFSPASVTALSPAPATEFSGSAPTTLPESPAVLAPTPEFSTPAAVVADTPSGAVPAVRMITPSDSIASVNDTSEASMPKTAQEKSVPTTPSSGWGFGSLLRKILVKDTIILDDGPPKYVFDKELDTYVPTDPKELQE